MYYPAIHELEKICLGILIGSAIFTLFLFLANIAGYPINLTTGTIILACNVIISGLFLLFNKKLSKNFIILKPNFGKFNQISKIFILIIFLLFVTSILLNVYWPVSGWDALTLYDFRGKFIAETGSIGNLFNIHRYYLSYPLYTSLVHTWIYLLGLNNPSFFYSLVYISFVIIFFFNLARLTNRFYALIFTLMLSISSEIYQHSLLAYTNLTYIVFLVLGFLYLYYWRVSKDNKYLYLSALLLGLSGWVRSSDPFWVVPLIPVFYYLVKSNKLLLWLKYTIVILLFKVPWSLYVYFVSRNFTIKSSNEINKIFTLNLDQYITRFVLVTEFFYTNVLKPNWLIILLFLAGLLLIIKTKKYDLIFFSWLIIFSLLIIFGGTYFYSLIYEKWQLVGDSVARMSMFLIPLVLFFQGILLFSYLNPHQEK